MRLRLLNWLTIKKIRVEDHLDLDGILNNRRSGVYCPVGINHTSITYFPYPLGTVGRVPFIKDPLYQHTHLCGGTS